MCTFDKYVLAENIKCHQAVKTTMSSNQFLWNTSTIGKTDYFGEMSKSMNMMQFINGSQNATAERNSI